MNLLHTIILGIVEGLTEFLPVSSTGHMIIAQKLLGIESTDFVKAFTVNIQFGAILSVIVLYWKRFFQSLDFYWKLLIAVFPALVIGFLLNKVIDHLLGSVYIVAIMLVVGGVFMLFVDKWFNAESRDQEIDWKRALKIGFFQCVAMIPGTSRSMMTIVGGMTTKLTRKNAAEFSFFLAVPTMAAAAGFKLLELIKDPSGAAMIKDNLITLFIGNVIAFFVAMVAIKFFIGFLTKHGFKAFGYYRIIIGIIILVCLFAGVNIQMAG
jgi:undecaprenyl-diphosphatase